jgi:hypothetical protein
MKPPLKPVLVIAGALLNRSLDMNHDLWLDVQGG